jgi:predicted amidophosphoribosyltransferase
MPNIDTIDNKREAVHNSQTYYIMDTKTFCGQCGTENRKENNFCFKCGGKLDYSLEDLTVTKTKPTASLGYFDIKETLRRLIKTNGFSIILIGEYYFRYE